MQEVVIGMAHRGRLNVLANVVGKSFGQIFREFEGSIDPNTAQGSGDVKYHVGAPASTRRGRGNAIGVTVASNPSHLEAVDPVVEGMVRAKQDLAAERARGRCCPCSSTATRRSPARAWWPRRSRCRSSPATAPAEPSTWS